MGRARLRSPLLLGVLVLTALLALSAAAVALTGNGSERSVDRPGGPAEFLCQGRTATIVGTPRDDRDATELKGTSGSDVIVGRGGDDVIRARGGDDIVCAGTGRDAVSGGDGDDTLRGRRGADVLGGGAGNDAQFGGRGADIVRGGDGDDILRGRRGSDRLSGGRGNDRLFGGPGGDACLGGPGAGSLRSCETTGDEDGEPGAGGPGTGGPDGGDRTPNAPAVADDDRATVAEDSDAASLDVRANDGDPEGDAFRVQSVTTPAHGRATVIGGGAAIGYTPDPDYCNDAASGKGSGADDTFSYSVTGGDTAAVSVVVECVPDDPEANDDDRTVTEDASATGFDVTVNDSDADADGEPIAITSASDPPHGTAAVNGAGTETIYTPDADFCGLDGFTYTINGGDTASVSVDVDCVDDPPTTVDDARVVAEDSGATTFDVRANDVDVDGGNSITARTNGAKGSVAITNDGADLAYTPAPDECGNDSFTYTLSPGSSTATVGVQITCLDDPPNATNDSLAVDEDAGFTAVHVLGNDDDGGDGGPVTVEAVGTAGTNGSVNITGAGAGVQYKPDADYCNSAGGDADDSFTYQLNGGSTGTVSVAVECVNDAPVNTAPAAATLDEDGTRTFSTATSNRISVDDVDLASSDLELTLSVGHGDLTLARTSGLQFSAGDGTGDETMTLAGSAADVGAALDGLFFAPDDDYNGPASLAITADDQGATGSGGARTDLDTVALTVGAVNDAPTLDLDDSSGSSDATALFTEGGIADLAPAADVADVDDTSLESATVTLASRPDGPAESLSVSVGATGISADYVTGTGVLTLSDTATVADYEQVLKTLRYANTDDDPDTSNRSVQVEVSDGSEDSPTRTTTLTVVAENDAPTVDLDGASPGHGSSATFTETDPHTSATAVGVAGNAGITDPDDTHLDSATITLTSRHDGNAESLSVDTTGTGITASAYDDSTGEITLSGVFPKSDYEKVIRSLEYDNTAAPPNATTRNIEVAVDDGDASSGTSAAQVSVVPINAPPDLDLNGAAPGSDVSTDFTEDADPDPLAPQAEVTDSDDSQVASATVVLTDRPDGDSVESLTAAASVPAITAHYSQATGTLSLTGPATPAEYRQVLRTVEYDNASDAPTTANRSVTFEVDDGQGKSPTRTATIAVTPANDAPVVDLNGTGTAGVDTAATFTEDGGAATLAPSTDITDVDDLEIETATVTLTNRPDGAHESLEVDLTGFPDVTATPYDSSTGQLVLTGPALTAGFAAILRRVTYENTDQDPDAAQRQVTFKVNDGAADSASGTAVTIVNVVDDPPIADLNGAAAGIDSTAAFTEDSAPANPGSGAVSLAAAGTVADADDANLSSATIILTNHPDGGSESLSVNDAGTGVNVSGNDSHSITLSGSRPKAEYQAVLRTLTYDNTSNVPETTDRIVEVEVGDGATDSAVARSTVSVTATNDAPSTDDETFDGTDSAIGNTPLAVGVPGQAQPAKSVGGDVLTGDADPEGQTLSVTGTTNVPPGAHVTMESDGNFVFTPTAGAFDTTQSFDYTVSDDDPTDPETASGQVTVAITGDRVWYVHSGAAAGGTGTGGAPFDALADLQGAGDPDGAGDTLMILDSAGYGGGLELEGSQVLRSKAVGLTVGSTTVVDAGGSNPTISNGAGNALTLAGGNTVAGVDLGDTPAANASLAGTSVGVAQISSGTIANSTGRAVDVTTGTLNATFASITSGGGTDGISLDGVGGTFQGNGGTLGGATDAAIDVNAGSGSFSYAGAIGDGPGKSADITGRTGGSVLVSGNINDTSDAGGGITMTGNTGGTTTFSGSTKKIDTGSSNAIDLPTTNSGHTLSFTNGGLDVDTTSGVGLNAQAGTTLNVAGSNNTIAASSGKAVDIDGGGANATSTLNTTFAAVSSSGSASDGIHLDDVSGTFSASGGTLQNASGQDFELTGNSSGDAATVTYDGSIADTTGTAVSISGQTGGTKDFNGAIGTVGSPAAAISLSGNTGATMRFDGGTILSTGTGDALSASGGGTLVVTDPNTLGAEPDNRLTTTTGTALKVANTGIGSGGLDFRSITSSGAVNGINLANTGVAGGLAVRGDGSDGDNASGGTIAGSTGPGILLTSSSNVSLASARVTTGGDDGIRGSNVSGLVLKGSRVSDNGNASDENGLDFTNLTGTVNFVNATVSGSGFRNFAVINQAGTLNATLTGGSYSNTKNSAIGDDSIFVEGIDSGTINLAIESATFTSNGGDHVQVTADSANTVTENVTISGNTMSNTVGGSGGGVTLNPGGNATMEASVLDNTITGANLEAITVDTPGSVISPQPAQVDATISGNTIGNAAVNLSGAGSGIGVRSNGAATVDALLTNNNVRQYSLTGIDLTQNDGNGTLNATLRGNTVTGPANTGESEPLQFGFYALIGSGSDGGTSCLDIGGAGALANNMTGSSSGTDPHLRLLVNGANATAQLAGYTGGVNDHAAVQTYLTGRNTAPNGARATQRLSTAKYGQAASCPLP